MNAEVLIKFKGDTSSADSATKKMNTSLGQLTKAFTLGNLAAKGITKAIQVFITEDTLGYYHKKILPNTNKNVNQDFNFL